MRSPFRRKSKAIYPGGPVPPSRVTFPSIEDLQPGKGKRMRKAINNGYTGSLPQKDAQELKGLLTTFGLGILTAVLTWGGVHLAKKRKASGQEPA